MDPCLLAVAYLGGGEKRKQHTHKEQERPVGKGRGKSFPLLLFLPLLAHVVTCVDVWGGEGEPALKSTQALHLPEKEREEEQAAAVVYLLAGFALLKHPLHCCCLLPDPPTVAIVHSELPNSSSVRP